MFPEMAVAPTSGFPSPPTREPFSLQPLHSNLSGAGAALLELPRPSCRHVARSVPASSQGLALSAALPSSLSWPQAECSMKRKRLGLGVRQICLPVCKLEMLLELCEPWTPGLEVKVNIWSLQGCHVPISCTRPGSLLCGQCRLE